MGEDERTILELEIPVAPGVVVSATLRYPMTEGEWSLMHSVLAAMKPGLVVPVTSQEESADG